LFAFCGFGSVRLSVFGFIGLLGLASPLLYKNYAWLIFLCFWHWLSLCHIIQKVKYMCICNHWLTN